MPAPSPKNLTARHVRLSLSGSVYDPNDAVGRLLFNVLAMVAEFEADLIRMRTKEGMRVAKAKGHLRGRQPKLNLRQQRHLTSLLDAGEYSIGDLADLFAVSRATVYRTAHRVHAEHPEPTTVAAAPATTSAPASAPVDPIYHGRHGG